MVFCLCFNKLRLPEDQSAELSHWRPGSNGSYLKSHEGDRGRAVSSKPPWVIPSKREIKVISAVGIPHQGGGDRIDMAG